MEFFYGKCGDEILKSSNAKEIFFLKNWIENQFFKKKKFDFYKIDKKIYVNKLSEILKKIKKKKFLKIFKDKHIPIFKKNLKKKNIYYPKYFFCHGDLTLSNIIINY